MCGGKVVAAHHRYALEQELSCFFLSFGVSIVVQGSIFHGPEMPFVLSAFSGVIVTS